MSKVEYKWPYQNEMDQEETIDSDVLVLGGGLSGCFAEFVIVDFAVGRFVAFRATAENKVVDGYNRRQARCGQVKG